jgi:hyperosmotically inducible periplasmic protein
MKNVALAAAVLLSCSIGLAPCVSAQDADNTARNVRDKDNAKPTAQHQDNDKSSVERTATLRKKIMAKKGLSVNAQNVKIVDEAGTIYLRGPVDTAKEKNIIDALAKGCCGTNYKNELEVKAGN